MSISLMAVAFAVLVELALAPDPDGAVVVVTGLPAPLTAPLVDEPGEIEVALPAPLTAPLTRDGEDAEVDVGAAAVEVVAGAAAVVVVVGPEVTGAAVPLAAMPEPFTVVAFTVVEPDDVALPEPVLAASTEVAPDALVRVTDEYAGLDVPVVAPVAATGELRWSTGAAVPLVATPEPLTVAAFTVVEPELFALPEPLLIELTLVEPMA